LTENIREWHSCNLDIIKVLEILPHRYPFLLVDRVTEVCDDGIKAYKNVSFNEPFFNGHFPGRPIMPGVLILEAMAQAGGILCSQKLDLSADNSVIYFMKIDKAKFRNPVVPGDKLEFEINLLKERGKIFVMKGKAFVDAKLVCEGEFMATITKEEK